MPTEPTPEMTDAQDTPDTPEAPGAHDAADAPNTPDTPAAPDTADTADTADTPDVPTKRFDELGLSEPVLRGIAEHGFEFPTDIQAELIPKILDGLDAIGQARTGTGKTAAFGLPILSQLEPTHAAQAIVLGPTRELAAQIAAELEHLGRYTGIGVVSIIGGESMRNQQRLLETGGHIVVGTPGRVLDLLGRGELSFKHVKYAVLDEVDRMLDIGFRDDIRKILGAIKTEHQTVFVSATVDDDIEKLGRRFMKAEAINVNVVSGSLTVARVDQKYYSVERWDKRALLLMMLKREKPPATVVFCRTKATVRKVTEYLRDKGLSVREIHGDLHQTKRNKVMGAMRDGNVDVLVASDLAARGLDIDHITHVINYDLPDDPEVYIHRIGRTARAGRRGVAWSYVAPDQGQLLTEIEKLTGALIEADTYPAFKPGRVPEDIRDERDRAAKRGAGGASTPGARVAGAVDTQDLADEELKKMFPNGVIPKNLPAKTLGSRFKRRGR
ncbi:MAG: DEAD/DEAH box helicase [Planctomycetota bacterium]